MRLALVFFLTATLAIGQEIRRPTADSSTTTGCPGVNQASTAMPLSWDSAGLSTSSILGVAGGGCRLFQSGICKIPGSNFEQGRRFTNWQSTATSYASLTLNVNSLGVSGGGSNDTACVSYSVNGGSSFTAIRCSTTSWAQITDTVTLNPAQDLTKLIVLVCASSTGETNFSQPTDSTVQLWDVWTVGSTTGGSNSGNGSGSGRQPDPIYISHLWRKLSRLIAGIA